MADHSDQSLSGEVKRGGAYPDLVEVEWDEFFEVMGPMDVTPRVRASTLSEEWTVSDWETRNRSRVGVSLAHNRGGGKRWMLEPHFAPAGR